MSTDGRSRSACPGATAAQHLARSKAAAQSPGSPGAGPRPCAVASRVQNALETALLHNAQLRDALVQQLGFAVKVRRWGCLCFA